MDIYQHFRKEEAPFIDGVRSWKDQVERTYIPKLTDFLDPREQQIVKSILGGFDEELKLDSFGGSPNSERKRMIIAPFYEVIGEEHFEISLLEATFQSKFINITHGDVMGAFLSLGLKREKLGDIFVSDGLIQLITSKEISPYVIMNLTSVKNASIELTEQDLNRALIPKANWVESTKTVSSLRLDTVVKEIYRMSRKDAQNAINKEIVKVNHRVVQDNKFMLEAGDMISFRGKGRSKLVSVDGQTRKEKWRITTAILQ
jgi:RNA-binding protein YlmH